MRNLSKIPFLSILVLSVVAISASSYRNPASKVHNPTGPLIPKINPDRPSNIREEIAGKYDQWRLAAEGIGQDVFKYAVTGYAALKEKGRLLKTEYITIIDFSKPSTLPRLFLLNMETGKILYKTLVAHGRNSGNLLAQSFSNNESSLESSPGFYITDETYIGKNGYSLKLVGCEQGFNSNAYRRGIVMHGADYVSEEFIRKNGFLGRSHGCPAVPAPLNHEIIDVIKNGSCLFIYFPSQKYLCGSRLLDPAA
jgi:hypothetical protein